MKTLKCIVAGFGFMGQTHAGSICNAPGMELTAVVDALPKEKIKPAAGNIKTESVSWEQLENVPFFQSLDEAIHTVEADAVIVATPNFLHTDAVLTALDAGKDVFVEKPLCATLSEAYQIREKAEKTGRLVQVGFVVRFNQPYCYLKDTLTSGTLGSLQYLQMHRYTGAPAWWQGVDEQEKMDTALHDLNIHDIDFAISLLGEPENVRLNQNLHRKFNTSLFASTWNFPGGTPVQIQGGFLRPSTVPFRAGFMAMFENGMLEFTKKFDSMALFRHTADGSFEIPLDPQENPFQKEILSFAECVRNHQLPEANVHAAIRDMEWIEKLVHKM